MHKPQKNTRRVGATAFSRYATKIRNNQKLILPRANHRERTKRLWISTMKCMLTTLAFTRQNLNGVFLTAFNVHVDTAALEHHDRMRHGVHTRQEVRHYVWERLRNIACSTGRLPCSDTCISRCLPEDAFKVFVVILRYASGFSVISTSEKRIMSFSSLFSIFQLLKTTETMKDSKDKEQSGWYHFQTFLNTKASKTLCF